MRGQSQQKECEMPRTRRSTRRDSPWLSPAQQRAWVAYMRVQLRMNYEINRQLHRDSDLSLADYIQASRSLRSAI